ncbi:MAG: type II 3-dehydroquinate dehydratase, partial [Defluviitaleaceae bacterium]|nr:type II 3-dehydroquinate dehydratase [Defluviitaleaceae bacterium]
MKIRVINGANLNFTGIRELMIYGRVSLEEINEKIINTAKTENAKPESQANPNYQIHLDFFQSNSEGAIVDYLQSCYNDKVDGIIFNPGAFSHYSYALRDAV